MINPGADKSVANVLVIVNTAKGIRFIPTLGWEGRGWVHVGIVMVGIVAAEVIAVSKELGLVYTSISLDLTSNKRFKNGGFNDGTLNKQVENPKLIQRDPV